MRFDLAFLDADKAGYIGYYSQVRARAGFMVHAAGCRAVGKLPMTVRTLQSQCESIPPGSHAGQHVICGPIPSVPQSGNLLSALLVTQLMDMNLILPGGAIVADNTLMKVCSTITAPKASELPPLHHGCRQAMASRDSCHLALPSLHATGPG